MKALSLRRKDIVDCTNICWMLGFDKPWDIKMVVDKYIESAPNLLQPVISENKRTSIESYIEILNVMAELKGQHGENEKPELVTRPLRITNLPPKHIGL